MRRRFLTSTGRDFRRPSDRQQGKSARGRHYRFLRYEQLESRQLLSVIPVTVTQGDISVEETRTSYDATYDKIDVNLTGLLGPAVGYGINIIEGTWTAGATGAIRIPAAVPSTALTNMSHFWTTDNDGNFVLRSPVSFFSCVNLDSLVGSAAIWVGTASGGGRGPQTSGNLYNYFSGSWYTMVGSQVLTYPANSGYLSDADHPYGPDSTLVAEMIVTKGTPGISFTGRMSFTYGGGTVENVSFAPDVPPDAPSAVSPADGATGVSLTPTLQASAYHDADGEAQVAAQFQMAADAGFTSILWDDTKSAAASSDTVAAGVLSHGNAYYWRVRYEDAHAWSDWSAGASFTTASDQPPTAAVTTPSGIQSGNVTIAYSLSDVESNPCSIVVQYSGDGGTSWHAATAASGGNGTNSLSSSPAGTSHTFVWASATDLGNTNNTNVKIRVTPSDAAAGTAGTTSAFTVNDYINQHPTAAVTTPTGVQTGNVTIAYSLSDVESDPCSIVVQYSGDGGTSWHTATAASGGNGTNGLSSSPAGTSHTFVWASATDLGNTNNTNAKIRITPSDAAAGTAGSSGAFTVNDYVNQHPTAAITTPSAIQTGNVTIAYGLSDVESDPCSIVVQYSGDGGANWHAATAGSGGGGTSGLASSPTGIAHTFVWASATDLGATTNSNVKIRITPSDAATGTAGSSAAFTVDNQPTFQLVGPTATTCQVGDAVAIQWTAGGAVPGGKISLCYDEDTTWWNGNEHWIEIDQVAAANGAGSYNWNTVGLKSGTYYVAGYLWTGSTTILSRLTHSLTVTAPPAPTFTLSGPTSGTCTVGQTVAIQWSAGNAASSTVSLCYDEDTTWWNGNEHWIEVDQVAAANGAGGYNWNTAGVKPGTYYLAGYLWNGSTTVFSHLSQAITIQAAAAPTFTISGPTSGTFTAGQSVAIQWSAGNAGAGSKISLCYDEDATWWNGNEHWIEVDQVTATNGSGSFTWDTTGVKPGSYDLAGYLWTGSTTVLSHLTQSIAIQAPAAPAFTLTGPTSGTFTTGQSVSIQWSASNIAPGSKISLCYDQDTAWWNGNEHWIEIDQVAAASGSGSFTWNTAGVKPGTYYLAGYLWTGSTASFSHLTRSITITSPGNSAIPYMASAPSGSSGTSHRSADNRALDHVFASLA